MYLFRIAALILSLFASLPALAFDLSPDNLRITLASEHVNSDADLNEFNPGLVLTWNGDWADISAGFIRNSFDNTAPIVTLSRDIWRNDTCGVGGFVGTARYTELTEKTDFHLDGWIPIGGLNIECGPVFLQAMPGRGIIGQASGPKAADAILVFGLTLNLRN